MFEYKDNTFYNNYFNFSKDFKLVKPFEKDLDIKNQYVGEIEVIESIHPLIVRVEIPFTFPHHKLMFYTKSIYGYPHLIDSGNGKDSWFCLNTPFAETPEEQLNQELDRLKGWVNKVMDKNLPARIDDPGIQKALRKIHAYIWENPDEILEFNKGCNVTFIGDFAYKEEFFKKNKGYFHCIKSEGNSFFIIEDEKLSNYKIPYIIINDIPNNFGDFVALKEQFNWSKETCDFLLPEFEAGLKEPKATYSYRFFNAFNESEANNRLNAAIPKLLIPDKYKDFVSSEIDKIRDNIKNGHGLKDPLDDLKDQTKRFPEETDEEYEYRMAERSWEEEYYFDVYPYILNYFMLGFKYNNQIIWKSFNTNRNSAKYSKTEFDLSVMTIEVEELVSWPLSYNKPQLIVDKQYFGRGKFNKSLTNKKVSIIGLGAIGSQVAISLARSGVYNFDLWDNDVIEPGNICRSSYTIQDLGNAKVHALRKKLKNINPLININEHGVWREDRCEENFPLLFIGGDLYGNINYDSQEDVISQLKNADLIIDCTASNELLHFLSYAIKDKDLISLCITNHAKNLLLVSNSDGNPFELRKFYLSKIEQDTKNFYAEGSGCFSPTFLALNCDIATLVNLAIRELNNTLGLNQAIHTTTWSFDKRGIIADRIYKYKLKNHDITLTISSEVMMDAEDLEDVKNGPLGFLLGGYSFDGKSIMITHCINASIANQTLADAYKTSNGIIDYIGDYCYASDENGNYSNKIYELLKNKANNEDINTNNPLLAVRTPCGSIFFYLYINKELIPFEKEY